MSGHHNFKILRDQLSPEAISKSDAIFRELEIEAEVYQRIGMREGVKNALADMRIGTLQELIEAMGGKLELIARFPDAAIKIADFEDA